MSGDSNVVAGPWPGSSRAAAPARTAKPLAKRPIPHRYRVGKHGPVQLMDCSECHTPWHPDVEVPRDRLCTTCRGDADSATPGLFQLDGRDG
ncbi:hypothetical protein [Nocardia sp. NPDC059228]|uniref:hypothetical protein n=1 Tax=Nocardia sp. NPDC059228 TaxID=3346777 RepID=UPI0036A9EA3B